MKRLTRDWVAKAEGDFRTKEREARVRREPNYDDICFHAQQCAEKYLKARLCEAGLPVPKIHDLVALILYALARAAGLTGMFRRSSNSRILPFRN